MMKFSFIIKANAQNLMPYVNAYHIRILLKVIYKRNIHMKEVFFMKQLYFYQ